MLLLSYCCNKLCLLKANALYATKLLLHYFAVKSDSGPATMLLDEDIVKIMDKRYAAVKVLQSFASAKLTC